jgi:transcription factor E2F7/8
MSQPVHLYCINFEQMYRLLRSRPFFFPGVIPVTSSELAAVNFHVTPLKLMVSPTPVAGLPVGNSPALASSHPVPVQNPSSAIVNFTLQHLGLISPSVQVSASPGPGTGTVPVSPRIEAVSVVPENAGSQQGRATNHDSPVLSQSQPNGQSISVTGTQQVRGFLFNLIIS